MFDRGELSFDVAFISMRDLGQVFTPVAYPEYKFKVVNNQILCCNKSDGDWWAPTGMSTRIITSKWIEVQ
jgi:hypothetical protein